MSKLIIAEKPSVAKSIASALGASSRADGFYEGSGLLVSWCVGHLVSPLDAGGYDERFKKWRYEDLPILPEPFRYAPIPGKEAALDNVKRLMAREDVTEIVNACDAGREGELIFRRAFPSCAPAPSMKPCISQPSAARGLTGWWGSTPPAFSPSSITVP